MKQEERRRKNMVVMEGVWVEMKKRRMMVM